ncbi:hypothetical protein NESM_000158000 [Novymonas esmeraldas]|uniref:Uncharacterized protein n=1 Tax=Novymonas esmeraldas TaxID=1808958 RepID=A0AAW0F591_9TRYP
MNQLEYFTASTHGGRSDIMRYMQQLRDLDCKIEQHLTLLRAITAERMAHQAARVREESSRLCNGRGSSAGGGRGQRGKGGRGRGRGNAATTATAAGGSRARHVHDVDASSQDDGGADDCAAEAAAQTLTAELLRQFAWHEMCVQRHCHEREALAAELAERCSEVRLSMASRLANFASVADVPMPELSG